MVRVDPTRRGEAQPTASVDLVSDEVVLSLWDVPVVLVAGCETVAARAAVALPLLAARTLRDQLDEVIREATLASVSKADATDTTPDTDAPAIERVAGTFTRGNGL